MNKSLKPTAYPLILMFVQVLQRKFDEFQKDMSSQEFRVTDVCETADKLTAPDQQHPESEVNSID